MPPLRSNFLLRSLLIGFKSNMDVTSSKTSRLRVVSILKEKPETNSCYKLEYLINLSALVINKVDNTFQHGMQIC